MAMIESFALAPVVMISSFFSFVSIAIAIQNNLWAAASWCNITAVAVTRAPAITRPAPNFLHLTPLTLVILTRGTDDHGCNTIFRYTHSLCNWRTSLVWAPPRKRGRFGIQSMMNRVVHDAGTITTGSTGGSHEKDRGKDGEQREMPLAMKVEADRWLDGNGCVVVSRDGGGQYGLTRHPAAIATNGGEHGTATTTSGEH
ncbi:hypothetical protein DFH27DRAFT_529786 [Peziza echinospora]|nr:hypothetical protein DFH27DRAFT_529786 [Peziza echinospora]